MRRARRALLSFVVAGSLAAFPAAAEAGGLYAPAHGTRPLGRGGAFTAGADDLGACWYNPAGVGFATGMHDPDDDDDDDATSPTAGGRPAPDRAMLVDFGTVAQPVSYTRVDSGGNVQPTVHNAGPPLPLPTLAYAKRIRDDLAVGAALVAPWAALPDYPLDGPQRYSMVSLVGSAFMTVEGLVAWHPRPHLYLGAGIEDLIARFDARVVASACPGKTVCQPEDPDYDAPSEMTMLSLLNPSLAGGAIYTLAQDHLRLGAAVQLPYLVSGDATLRVRIPSAAFFNGAQVNGNQAQISFTLPLLARAGIEGRALGGRLRAELEGDYERWSSQDRIAVDPQNVTIGGAPGIGTYQVGPLDFVRGFRDTWAAHFGVEAQAGSLPLWLRAGYAYETGAPPPNQWLTVATLDTNKQLFAAGVGFTIDRVRFDLSAAYVLQPTVVETDSQSLQLNPIRGSQPVAVGNGTYRASMYMAGLAASSQF